MEIGSQSAQFVRITFLHTEAEKYRISGVEVLGDNELIVVPQPLPPAEPDGRQYLTGGNWKLRRASEVTSAGTDISTSKFVDDKDWIIATVPATVLG
jgi:hypothetical protein